MIRVTKNNPCPVCGRGDWCLVAEDGSACICARVSEGAVKRAGDAGWLHKLTGETKRRIPKRKPEKPKPDVDFLELTKKSKGRLTLKRLQALSDQLGVSEESLRRLDMGWDGRNYTFPMRSGYDKIIGVRVRGKDKKWSVRGSASGLFWPAGVRVEASTETLWICEGPTDCAALLDLGFSAIGRPNCSGGTKDIIDLLTYARKYGNVVNVIIMADKDPPKTRPDGSEWFPGQEGAMRLAKTIKLIVASVRVIKPPANKDIRDWYRTGATKEVVLAVAENSRFV